MGNFIMFSASSDGDFEMQLAELAPQKHEDFYESLVQVGLIPDLDYVVEGSFEVVFTEQFGKLNEREWVVVKIKTDEQEKGYVWAFCECSENLTPHRDWKFVDEKDTAMMMIRQIEKGI